MKPTKFLILPSLCIITIIILGMWVSTQWVAALLGYPPQLGQPWTVWGNTPIYPPLFIIWWLKYGVYAQKQFDLASTATYIGVLLGVVAAVAMALHRARQKKNPTYHGSARWAELRDIKESGLLNNKGVVLGLTQDGQYLRHDGPEHVLVMAPTRSGKGVGIIIPTLLTWPHSVLVTDIKGENWGITAGFRQKCLGNRVLKFDPTCSDGSSVRFNPLDEIRLRTVNEVRDVQNIADMLVDPQGTGQLDHWSKTGHALLVGVALHLKYEKPNATLTDIASLLSDPSRSFEETLVEMMSAIHDTTGLFKEIYGVDSETHPVVAQAARELLNKSENERSGVLSTAMSFLGLYRDPVVSYNTAVSEFSINDLMNNDDPVSLYLVVPPSDINRVRPLIRMILNQVVRRLTEKMTFKDGKPVKSYKQRLLLLLDEFPALGRLDAFEAALAYIAGYGLKSLLIIQSLNQLKKTYTQNNSIVDNCHVRIVYTPNDAETPEFISKMLGTKTEVIETRNYQGDRLMPWLPKVSTNIQHVARPLLTAGEVLQLPEDEEIIFVAGHPPIRAKKLRYYQDRNFTKRLIDAPETSDRIREVRIKTEIKVQEETPDKIVIGTGRDLEFYDDDHHDYVHEHDQSDPFHGHDHETDEEKKDVELEISSSPEQQGDGYPFDDFGDSDLM
ncbi:MAG TPA: IncP-type conjugal transfer protein TraG [Firmicutes bacterium]|jgi:type IV secretion system protein VirD4|nr:IncP-type conjugal transfer protein TraG [Bacillota bacterium]